MNSISFFKALLMRELDEKKYSDKQMDIADEAPPYDEITRADFKVLRKKKDMKEDESGSYSNAVINLLNKVAKDWGKDSDLYNELEDTIVGYVDKSGNLSSMGKAEVKELLANYDVLDDYGPLLEPGLEETMSSIKEVKLDYDFNEDELEKIIQTLKRHHGTLVNPINAMEKALGKKVAAWNDFPIDEGQDHEVAMAHNSLESIIKSAMELKAKLGNDERDIPGWIQDHITNAENYIDQAAQGFHELDHHDEESDMDELPVGDEEVPMDDMTLQSLMEDLIEAKKKPSAGLTKKQKSAIVKKAISGKDIGKKGKGFEKIVKAAEKGGARDPQAVAAAAMWKSQAKKAK